MDYKKLGLNLEIVENYEFPLTYEEMICFLEDLTLSNLKATSTYRKLIVALSNENGPILNKLNQGEWDYYTDLMISEDINENSSYVRQLGTKDRYGKDLGIQYRN